MTPVVVKLVNVGATRDLWSSGSARRFYLTLDDSQALTPIDRDRFRKPGFGLPETMPQINAVQSPPSELRGP